MKRAGFTIVLMLCLFTFSVEGATITFQPYRLADGTPDVNNGYQYCASAALQTGEPNWDGSAYATPWCAANFPAINARMMVIRFENLFGSGNIQIPVDSKIKSATLWLNVVTAYMAPPTGVTCFTGLTDWYSTTTDSDFSTVAWRKHDAGISWDGDEVADTHPRDNVDFWTDWWRQASISVTEGQGVYSVDQYISFDVTDDVRAFQNGVLANYGWWIGTNQVAADGMYQIGGSESGWSYQPKLVVEYNSPPDYVDASTNFNSTDATDALQAAIDTGAKEVNVPNMGAPWIIRPVFLTSSNQKIHFADGVIVQAKRGEFHGDADSLFTAYDQNNITIEGDGATLQMWKQDYTTDPNYSVSESRMGIRLYSDSNMIIQGLTIKDTGGDGIYLGKQQPTAPNRNIHIKDIYCNNNYRQGISVISAKDLLIENCILNNTVGQSPESGIDFEPDSSTDVLENCVVRNCIFQDNHLCGPLWNIWDYMDANTLSGSFENCTIIGSYLYGSKIRKYLPNWTIKDCIFVNNGLQTYPPYPGVGIYGEYGPTNQTVIYSAFYGNKDGASSGYITLGTGCLTNQQPLFVSTDVSNPRYMYLAENCPTAIKQGDSEGGFMGARAPFVQLFYDGFESNNFTVGGWTNSGCDIQSTYKYASTYAARFNSSDTLSKSYSTTNYKNIQVKYARYTRSCETDDHFISEWYDGVSWHTMEDLTGNSNWTSKVYDLPAGADNNSNFQIRFRTSHNGSTDYAYFDEVKIVGGNI